MAQFLHKAFQISLPNQILLQQKRFRGKINIQKPRKPHYTRGVFDKFLTPFYKNKNKDKTLLELCTKPQEATRVKELTPYHDIIAREVRNWFDNSKMIAFLHKNAHSMEDQLDLAIPLRKKNMYLKSYSAEIMNLALKDSPYSAVKMLYSMPFYVVFCPENNVADLVKILKTSPFVILMAGILEGRLLNLNDFLRFGEMDITTARVSLVQVLQNAGGNTLNQQITHHQSTLVSRLQQISTNEVSTKESDKSDPV